MTCFDLLQPQLKSKVIGKQKKQKQLFDRHTKDRDFVVGDLVYVRNFSKESPRKCIPGTIVQCQGNVVHLQDSNNIVKRHNNQMRHCMCDYIPEIEVSLEQTPIPVEQPHNERYPTRNRRPPRRFDKESWH